MSRKLENDHLILSLDQMLNDFSNKTTRPFIHRVDDILRTRNEKAYDPVIIAIGPFHRNKDHLMNMEHHKMSYLKLLLESRQESSVDRYVNAMRDLEERARKCYGESIPLEKDEFVKMLLLDGIFIIEFLRKLQEFNIQPKVSQDDPIFQFEYIRLPLVSDLLMFENQIPLFVLEELFRLLEIDDREEIHDLILSLTFPGELPKEISLCEAEHLLGLVHYASCYSWAQEHSPSDYSRVIKDTINSAVELKEACIIFKKHVGTGISLFDIKFKNQTIYIPKLSISDGTEAEFRNMLAYEYYFPSSKQKYITDYILFLCSLIHSPEDAELLRRCGIIKNLLGGDEMVCNLINQLGTNVMASKRFSYSGVFRDINCHCRRRRNRWMALLRRDYFDSPWAFISLVAAIVLLSTAVAQMVYGILSYNNAR